MTWTYSNDPSASDKDAIRFEIQDTDPGAPLLQDEELVYTLNQEAGTSLPRAQAGIFSASARCCEVLARRFSAQADSEVGSLKVTYSTAAAGYATLAKELRAKAQGYNAPYSGGQSIDEKEGLRTDPDRVQGFFGRDQFRTPFRGFDNGFPPTGPVIGA